MRKAAIASFQKKAAVYGVRYVYFGLVLIAMVLLALPRDALFRLAWTSFNHIDGNRLIEEMSLSGVLEASGTGTYKDRKGYVERPFKDQPTEVRLRLVLDYPKRAVVGDSFLVRAGIESVEVIERPGSNRQRIWHEEENPRMFSAADAALEELSWLSLIMAGAKVRPQETVAVVNRSAVWSVQPEGPGRLSGAVSGPSPRSKSFIFRLKNDAVFTVDAYENPFARGKLLSWIPKLLGSLLTIPGIVAFVREYRRRREAAREAAQREKRILIP